MFSFTHFSTVNISGLVKVCVLDSRAKLHALLQDYTRILSSGKKQYIRIRHTNIEVNIPASEQGGVKGGEEEE